jgi:hypothetical protein
MRVQHESRRRRRRRVTGAVLGAILLATAAESPAAPVVGQINDFENGTTQGWTNGRAADPVNLASGGPLGSGDNFLLVSASGGGGAGSRLIVYNSLSQWTGNFTVAGVTSLEMDLRNSLNQSPLSIRLALEEASGSRFATSQAFTLAAGTAWQHAKFDLLASNFTSVSGSTPAATALTRVTQFRILYSTTPSYMGASFSGSFAVDNIRAVPEPAAGFVSCIAAVGLLLARRRRR